MKKFIKGDEVVVITGESKGTVGKILEVRGDYVVIKGVNVAIKHVKPDMNRNVTGGRVEFERPINISNVALYNRESSKRDKVQFKIENGKKFRCYKSNGQKIVVVA
jgi:large subunit ribosomal protein L24